MKGQSREDVLGSGRVCVVVNATQRAVTPLSTPAAQTGPSRQLRTLGEDDVSLSPVSPPWGVQTVGEAVHVREAFVFLLNFAMNLILL